MKLIILIILISLFIYYNNKFIKIDDYNVQIDKLPSSFDGFKIMQIADLHNTRFGRKQKNIIKHIKKREPDIVVFTGDFIDYNRFDKDIKKKSIPVIELLDEINKLEIKMYMIFGNHEAKFRYDYETNDFIKLIKSKGVEFIGSKSINIYRDNENINLIGINDPYILLDSIKREQGRKDNNLYHLQLEVIDNDLKELLIGKEKEINIVLSHRPEMIDLYSKYKIDVVMTGHAHGGQIRVPMLGGLYAPHQGNLPKYTSGIHKKENTVLIISRGLGNSRFPLRINNRPQLLNIILKQK